MKKLIYILLVCLLSALYIHPLEAGTFVSGSTGADGPFNPPTQVPAGTVVDGSIVTVPLPASGVFNFSTFNIPAGTTLKFNRNTANTPVHILATGDVDIAGTIDVSGADGAPANTGNIGPVPGGKGGPGGYDGGYGGEPGSTGVVSKDPGNGLGPGGGKAANVDCSLYVYGSYYYSGGGGGFGTDGVGHCSYSSNSIGGNSYGSSTLLPLIGGSGGGGARPGPSWSNYGGGGGGGGGAVLIASSTKITVIGSILANGGNQGAGYYNGGCGSGGAIRMIANAISGTGILRAMGGSGPITYLNDGGKGRIRLEGFTITINDVTPAPTIMTPGLVFFPQTPSLSITKVAGNTVPAAASGSYTSPDVTLPSSTTNPISVEIAGTNIPVGTTVQVDAIPQNGTSSSATASLSGTDASSTATASLSISTTYPSIIMAQTTFNVQMALFYNGEKIEKVRVASSIGRESKVTYFTKSGKEISAEILLAALTK